MKSAPLRLVTHGSIAMAYEFASVKALGPYYGSGLNTWAITISAFLLAYTIGGFIGGYLTENKQHWGKWIGLTATTFALLCLFQHIVVTVFGAIPSFYIGLTLSVTLLCFLPFTLLTALIPIHLAAINASPTDQARAYAWAGIGNVLGTLIVTFALLPLLGLQLTNILLAIGVVFLCATWHKAALKIEVNPVYLLIGVLPLGHWIISPVTKNAIYTNNDAHGWIAVLDKGDYRFLIQQDGAKRSYAQTVLDKKEPLKIWGYLQGIMEAKRASIPHRVYQIGLGGGGINRLLRATYPNVDITTAEINPEVVKVAQEFFGFQPSDKDRVVTQDARYYIQHTSQTYDWIILDAFLGINAPEHLRTTEFFQVLHDRLEPNGVLAVNLVIVHPSHQKDLGGLIKIFPYVYVHPINEGQIVVLATKQPLKDTAGLTTPQNPKTFLTDNKAPMPFVDEGV